MSLQIILDEERHYICTLKNNEMTTTFSIEYKTSSPRNTSRISDITKVAKDFTMKKNCIL